MIKWLKKAEKRNRVFAESMLFSMKYTVNRLTIG